MRISDEALEYWGEVFEREGLARYIRFDTFLRAPRTHLVMLKTRPMLPEQKAVQARLDAACEGLQTALDELERQVADLRRIDNGHCYEPLKHHAHGRS